MNNLNISENLFGVKLVKTCFKQLVYIQHVSLRSSTDIFVSNLISIGVDGKPVKTAFELLFQTRLLIEEFLGRKM